MYKVILDIVKSLYSIFSTGITFVTAFFKLDRLYILKLIETQQPVLKKVIFFCSLNNYILILCMPHCYYNK